MRIGAPGGPLRPDILVLILDTVRASDFPGGADAVPGLRNLELLRRESTEFRHAFAPAPWTVPSHASLLTGLAPWEHMVHLRGRARLDPSIPTFARSLRDAGYRSICLSANPYLGPVYGMTDDFDEVYWGGWHEPFLRGIRARPRARGDAVRRASPLATVAGRGVTDSIASAIQRHPWAWEKALRVGHALAPPEVPTGAVASWIEPTLEAFLARQPADRPLACLVNLLDAHEPYLGLPGAPDAGATPRQDRRDWVRGVWEPTEAEYRSLHSAYRRSFHVLDDRVGRILSAFQRHRVWDRTTVITTSDHGQAFGEQGVLYHGLRIGESLVGVPLLLRSPGGVSPGTRLERTSIAAIHGFVLDAAGLGRTEGAVTNGLTSPPTAIADGLLTGPGAVVPMARRTTLDRAFVASYDGARKVTLDVHDGQLTEYDLDADPSEQRPAPAEEGELGEHLREVARTTFGGGRRSVTERLSSWGYL